MKLSDLTTTFSALRFPRAGEDAHPDRDAILEVRARVREALLDDELLADCIEHELQLVADDRVRYGLVPFYTMPVLGVRFAFGYWPPGGTPGPHEHTAWTITAVCRNRLEVATFDRAESYRRRELVAKNRFDAGVRQVGFIYEPSIHAPKNTSSEWSLSLHITSPRDGEPLAGVEPLPGLTAPLRARAALDLRHPYMRVLKAREDQRIIDLLARTALDVRAPAAGALLARCFQLGSSSTRRMLCRARPEQFRDASTTSVLARTDRDLALSIRRDHDGWAFVVDTPRGPIKAFGVNDLAHDALVFASARTSFAVAALPGSLSADERLAIAETLEDAGLFQRIEP